MTKITAPIFAILTPFEASGKIDFSALSQYLLFLQQTGVETILTNGTTAEFPSLSLEERMALVEHCRQQFNGVILNNVSSCCLGDCLKLVDHSKNYADGLVVLPPYYYAKTSEKGLSSFLAEVLNQSPLPTYLYNFPKHTQNPITLAMVKRLLTHHDNLVGLKDSSADLESALKFKALKKRTFQVFVGGDRIALDTLKSGLDGSVTGGGNAFPELLIAISRFFQASDLEKAQTIQHTLNEWSQFRKQHRVGEIVLTKIALHTRLEEFPTFVRPPLIQSQPTELEKIELFIHQLLPLRLDTTT